MSDPNTEQEMPFSEWLEKKYLKYQVENNRRVTLGEFAETLGISQGLLSHYLKGIRKPRIGTVHKLSNVLGSEIYPLLGYEIPDLRLKKISHIWVNLSEDQRDALLEEAEKFEQK